MKLTRFISLSTVITFSLLASADLIDDGDNASFFNAFVFGDHNAGSADVEGRLVVGNNFTSTADGYSVGASGPQNLDPSYGIGPQNPQSNGTRNDFIVGGNLDVNNLGLTAVYGNTVVGGSILNGTAQSPGTANNNTISQNLGKANLGVDFQGIETQTKALSTSLSTATANGSYVNESGNIILTGTNANLNIFNLSAAEWGAAGVWGRTIDVPTGSTVLINLSGQSLDVSGGVMTLPDYDMRNTILFNLYEATTISLAGTSIEGSVLAPLAHLTLNGGSINGQGVISDFTQTTNGGGEFHNHEFTGDLAYLIPEPGSLIFMGLAGLATLATLRFRKNA